MKKLLVLTLLIASTAIGVEAQKSDPAALKQATHILTSPDSALTREQADLKYNVCDFLISRIEVVGNQMKFSVTAKEFTDKGFPAVYYDLLVAQLASANAMFASMDGDFVKNMVDQTKQAYLEQKAQYLQRCTK